MPACPNGCDQKHVTTNKLFSVNNPKRWFCEGCDTFFDR